MSDKPTIAAMQVGNQLLRSERDELKKRNAELEMALENTAHNIKHCTPIAVCDGKCFRHECVCTANSGVGDDS